MDWKSLLANKDIRSALIALVSALLTWGTDAVAAWSGTSIGAFAPAVMAAWAVAVNAAQTRIRKVMADSADDAANEDALKPPNHEWLVQRLGEPVASENLPENFEFGDNVRWWPLRGICTDSLGALLETRRDVLAVSTKRLVLMIAAVLSLAACANAAAPRAIVTGPNTGTPGEFLTLDASTSEGDPKHFRWSIAPELRGRKQLLPSLTGERCTVASFPGRYLITLAVANDDGIDSLTWQIEIPGNAPCPPPEPQPVTPQPVIPPGPTPIPQPVNPVQPVTPVNPQPQDNTPGPGEFNVAPAVYQAAKAATSPTRVHDCQRLASECRRIAGGPADSLNTVAAEMVKTLVTLPAGWDVLKTKVKTTVAALAIGGKIKSAADLQRLLLELADAFDRAAR